MYKIRGSRAATLQILRWIRQPRRARGITNLKRLVHFTPTSWNETAKPMDFYNQPIGGLDRLIDAFETALEMTSVMYT
jgi:hypothetical protein